MKQLVFFNNKGGVGKTTLLFHLGFALERQGKKILLIDADPQCNLTSYACTDAQVDAFWSSKVSIRNVVDPLVTGTGDIDTKIQPQQIPGRNVWLLPGDILLSDFEEILSQRWVDALAGRELGFRATSGIFRYLENWATANQMDYVLIDIGPNMGALNRAVLLGCNYFILPMVPDLFSIRGLSNLGTNLTRWMDDWDGASSRFAARSFRIQGGKPAFAGYVSSHFNVYRSVPTEAWKKWDSQIPSKVKTEIVDKLTTRSPSLVIQMNGANYHLGDMKTTTVWYRCRRRITNRFLS